MAVLRREKDADLKRLWIDVLRALNQRAAVDALVDFSLNDPDEDLRHLCVESLIKSGRPGLATPYAARSRTRDNEIVNRRPRPWGKSEIETRWAH